MRRKAGANWPATCDSGRTVVAMAGFAFPLRLDTSMAEFDFGKLFCTLFLARGVIQLILDAVLWLVMLSIAEPWLGRARTVGTALACALGGVIVGLTLCAAAGWLFRWCCRSARLWRPARSAAICCGGVFG